MNPTTGTGQISYHTCLRGGFAPFPDRDPDIRGRSSFKLQQRRSGVAWQGATRAFCSAAPRHRRRWQDATNSNVECTEDDPVHFKPYLFRNENARWLLWSFDSLFDLWRISCRPGAASGGRLAWHRSPTRFNFKTWLLICCIREGRGSSWKCGRR
jgi:hypothetical protein